MVARIVDFSIVRIEVSSPFKNTTPSFLPSGPPLNRQTV